jgi:hypothetical protein
MVFHYTSIIISFVKPFSCTNIFIYQFLLLQHVCLPCFHVSLMLLLTLFFHEQFLGELFVVWNGYVWSTYILLVLGFNSYFVSTSWLE